MSALPHSGGCACFGLLPIPSSACIAWKFPAGTVHNPSLLKQPISNGMKHPARTSPSVVCFAPERWSLCAYYFPPRRSALFPWPIKPNISRPPRRDTNGSASNRFILVQERMNHRDKTVEFKRRTVLSLLDLVPRCARLGSREPFLHQIGVNPKVRGDSSPFSTPCIGKKHGTDPAVCPLAMQ